MVLAKNIKRIVVNAITLSSSCGSDMKRMMKWMLLDVPWNLQKSVEMKYGNIVDLRE